MMKRLQLWVRNIFGFSRGETNGFLILLPLMLLVLFSQPIYQWFFHPSGFSIDENQAKLDSLIANWDFNPVVITNNKTELFEFDPNTSTLKEFNDLGFPSYLSKRIINYREKGGKFRKANDLLKIYGMDSTLFFTVLPYISIPNRPSNSLKPNVVTIKPKKESKTIASFDLNLADTSQLKSIRGVGTILAKRIIKYRNALGGFANLGQIKEVYGLDTTVVQALLYISYIQPGFVPNQLDINKATEQQFSVHPYIKSKLAKTIITYRFQHGSFSEIDDLLKIDLIDQETYNNIRPYLKIEP